MDIKKKQSYEALLLGKRSQYELEKNSLEQRQRQGVLLDLFLLGDKESIALLKTTVSDSPFPDCAKSALSLLVALTKLGNQTARQSLFDLAIYDNHQEAASIAIENQWAPEDKQKKALFLFLTDQLEAYFAFDPHQAFLTEAYFGIKADLKTDLISMAKKRNLGEWLSLITVIDDDDPQTLNAFMVAAWEFKPAFRQTAFKTLTKLANQGSAAAQAGICRWFIEFESEEALSLALENDYHPIQPTNRALFLMLSGQWEAYNQYDFDRSYLALAYELANRALRRRIITQAKKLGRIEWARVFSSGRKIRFAEDMHAEEWQLAVEVLSANNRWQELWRLVNHAPPLWASKALIMLAESGWQKPRETVDLDILIEQAKKIIHTTPDIYLMRTFPSQETGITSLAAHPQRDLLITASRDQAIRIWKSSHKTPIETLTLKSGLALTMKYDPEEGLLTTGNSDNRIYIFRLHDHHLVKTFTGHSAPVRALTQSDKGHILASGSFDRTIRVWRYPFGPELHSLEAHKSEIFALAGSPLEPVLASSGADKTLRTYHLPELTPIEAKKAHQDTILALASGQSSQTLASSSRDHSIKLWSFSHIDPSMTLPTPDSVFGHLAFLMDDQYLLGGDTVGQLALWRVHDGETVFKKQAHISTITGLQSFNNGHLLASCSMDGAVNIWLLSLFNLARTPLPKISSEQINTARKYIQNQIEAPEAHSWLSFIEHLIRWRSRFDIQLGEPQRINLGDFDIEL